MGFRNDIRALAYELRAMAGRDFEIRPYSVAVVVKSWSGDNPGEGTESTDTTVVTEANSQPPKVRILNDEQIALGNLPRESIKVGPITPDFPGGGTNITTLTGNGATVGESFYYLITGPQFPSGARFLLEKVESDRTFGYSVTLKPFALA